MRDFMAAQGKYFLLIMFAACIPFSASPGRAAETYQKSRAQTSVKVMSFNIRTIAPTDGLDYWSFRKGEVAGLINRHAPDVAGLQEVYPIQARALKKRLPDYEWFGAPREDGEKIGEMCAVFYRRERLHLLEQGTFWLSKDPDQVGSRSWDAAFPRVVTWGKFKDKKSGAVFYVFNTHFDHQGKKARKESARILAERLRAVAGDLPAVVTGDFNASDDSIPYRTITAALEDSRLTALSPPLGPEGTSRGFRLDSKVGRRIDYIFVTPGVKVTEHAVLDDTYGKGRRPADHMPVLVSVEIPKSK
jgi:endonuclease/exonuclease/phosphatase family metal-dependent hydrolase